MGDIKNVRCAYNVIALAKQSSFESWLLTGSKTLCLLLGSPQLLTQLSARRCNERAHWAASHNFIAIKFFADDGSVAPQQV